MSTNSSKIFEHWKQIEILADQVLSDRREIIELNKRRDKLREASRAIKSKTDSNNSESKTWFCVGRTFIKFNKHQTTHFIEKDYSAVDKTINNLNSGLKSKVGKLFEAENKPDLKRYNLVPLSQEDKQSLKNIVTD